MSEANSYSNNFSAVRHLFVANSNTSESSSESESIVGICEDYLIGNDSDPSAHDEEHSHASRDWKTSSCVHETLTPIELNEQALLSEELYQEEEEEEESNEFVGDAQDRVYYINAAHNFYSAYLEHQNRFEPNSLQHYGIKCNGKPINYVLRQIRGLGASLGVIQLSSLLSHSSSSVTTEEHKSEKEEKDEAMKSKTDCKKGLRTRSRSRNIDITTCPTATGPTTTTTNTTTTTQSALSGNSNETNIVANVHNDTNYTGVNSTLRTHVVTAMERVRTSIIAQAHTLRCQQQEQQQQLVDPEIRRRENSGTSRNNEVDEDEEEDHVNNSPRITPLRHPSAPARPSQRYQHQEPFRPLSRLADANKRTSMSAIGERSGMEPLRIGRSHGRDNSAIDGDGDGDGIHISQHAHINNGNIQKQEKGYTPHGSNTSHLHNSNHNNNNNETNNSILCSTSCVSNQRIVNTLFEPLLHGTAYKQSEPEEVHHHHHLHSDKASCLECKLDEEAS